MVNRYYNPKILVLRKIFINFASVPFVENYMYVMIFPFKTISFRELLHAFFFKTNKNR